MRVTTQKPITVAALRHSGTHLIIPVVRYLTGKTVYSPKGEQSLICEPSPLVIVFVRDPRNWIVSSFRFKKGKDFLEKNGTEAADVALAGFIGRNKRGTTPVQHGIEWARRWLEWPNALYVRFEELSDPSKGVDVVERVREFTGAHRNAAEVYREVFGMSGTYTGRHSRWEEWFGKQSTKAWKAAGGNDLVAILGYEK